MWYLGGVVCSLGEMIAWECARCPELDVNLNPIALHSCNWPLSHLKQTSSPLKYAPKETEPGFDVFKCQSRQGEPDLGPSPNIFSADNTYTQTFGLKNVRSTPWLRTPQHRGLTHA